MDIIAGLFELIGLYIIGCKKAMGFILCAVGNIVWISYVFYTHSTYGLLIVCIPAFLINLINWRKWQISSCIPDKKVYNSTKAYWNK